MQNISAVLRSKRVQLAELVLEIDGLEAAEAALRLVIHLLTDDESPQGIATPQISMPEESTPTTVADVPHVVPPERSRIRRWV